MYIYIYICMHVCVRVRICVCVRKSLRVSIGVIPGAPQALLFHNTTAVYLLHKHRARIELQIDLGSIRELDATIITNRQWGGHGHNCGGGEYGSGNIHDPLGGRDPGVSLASSLFPSARLTNIKTS